MSGSQTPPGGGTGRDQPGADPSMEDILASIRRILSEDVPQPATLETSPPPGDSPSDVLVLDQSMMVPEPVPAEPPRAPEPVAEARPAAPERRPESRRDGDDLVAPEAAAATALAVNSLVRRLSAERGTQVRSGGPTIEDMVREELRPMLKQWLDTYLPPMVERLVKAEIERVVGRVVP
ncbi:MAG TPA: DUF2497 domain-containing protein [Acetobacteraceae bacterium]|nr:DUF2497 domain-containing protein [Acetobacteraceae bacterium]